MTVDDLKVMKKRTGMTNAEIAERSGIPFSTVNKIFSGATKNPRYATLLAIEQVLATGEEIPFTYDWVTEEPMLVRDVAMPYAYQARTYNGEDIEKLSENVRAELIQGVLYMLSAPNRMHQFLITQLMLRIGNHIQKRKGGCHVYTSPFDVRLFGDDSTVVQPDILVVCNKNILTEKGCSGAPDWLIEIVSASNSKHDYNTKLMQYQRAGVREYWIVDPFERKISVMNFENASLTEQYSYEQEVPSGVLDGFSVRFAELEEMF